MSVKVTTNKPSLNWKDEFSEVVNSYQFTAILPSTGETITFKPVDTKTLKSLLVLEKSEDYSAIENLFDSILSHVIVSPELDLDQMLLFDRQKLLMDIRNHSKGQTVQQTYTCPKCQSQSIQTVDFSKLPYKEYKEPEDGFIEIAKGIGIVVGHITRGEQKAAYEFLSLQNDIDTQAKEALSPLYMLAGAIKSYVNKSGIKDDLTFEDKFFMLESLPDSVLEKFKNWMKANSFGYQVVFSFTCPHCKHVEEIKEDDEF